MTAKWKQPKKIQDFIQIQVSKRFPGVVISWEEDANLKVTTPTIHLPDEQIENAYAVIAAVKEAASRCGSRVLNFMPENAYITETGELAPL